MRPFYNSKAGIAFAYIDANSICHLSLQLIAYNGMEKESAESREGTCPR